MITVTGDTHGGFQRFAEEYFPQQREMGRDDFVIVCGDFGGVWDGSVRERRSLDWLEDKPFSTLFVDGNHENFDLLEQFPLKMWHGGRVRQVRDHVLHLTRGQVFEIGGLTWFTMGGGASHDIEDGILEMSDPNFEEKYRRLRQAGASFRVNRRSWWAEEMPGPEEYEEAAANLERAGWCVDCVLTHSAPSSILRKIRRSYQPDPLTEFLEQVNQRCQFSYWFFGHYHKNRIIDERYILQWEQMVKLDF